MSRFHPSTQAPQSLDRQSGVTLLELMITIGIVAILLTVVAPNVQSILINNRIAAEINELSGIIQFARSHAIDEQAETIVCPSENFAECSNNWDQGKIVFSDTNGDGERNDDEPLLVASSPISSVNTLSGPANVIRFQGNGSVTTPATLLLCHQNLEDQYARALIISLQGRVRLSQDRNGDGIHEDNAGTALDCGS